MENIGRIISGSDVIKLFRLLELANDNNYIYYISEKEIDELKEILILLEFNNGKVNENVFFNVEQIHKIRDYLTKVNSNNNEFMVDNSESLSVEQINKMLEKKEKVNSVFTEEEKNNLIASYGNCDNDVFAIRLDYLNAIYITNDDNDVKYFNHKFSHRSLASLGNNLGKSLLELGDNYTLLKYIGNNEFKEFYTGKTVIIYREAVEDTKTFLTKLDYYRENPLCILIGLKNLEVVSENIEKKIISNVKKRDDIVNFIENAISLAKQGLEDDLFSMINEDFLYADETNKIYEFKKR